jgi:hypothetical protein
MAKEPVTVTISNDPATLGSDATQRDIEQYAIKLAAYLNDDFEGLDISVKLDSVYRSTSTHQGVEERVREIESSDEWIALAADDD